MTCSACGFRFTPVPPPVILFRPAGSQKALIGYTPLYQAVTGLFMIIVGIVFASINSSFTIFAAIPILFGLVLLILGLMGKPIYAQQVVYETASPTTNYEYQTGPMKRCPRCGNMIPAYALICEKCGASQ
jgi:zinc-ribbon domain